MMTTLAFAIFSEALQSSNAELLRRVAEDYGLSKTEVLARYGYLVPCAAINKKNRACKRFAAPRGLLCTLHAKRPDVRIRDAVKPAAVLVSQPEAESPRAEPETESPDKCSLSSLEDAWDELERMLMEETEAAMD